MRTQAGLSKTKTKTKQTFSSALLGIAIRNKATAQDAPTPRGVLRGRSAPLMSRFFERGSDYRFRNRGAVRIGLGAIRLARSPGDPKTPPSL